MTAPVLELSAVSKDYHGLRPLRIEQLTLAAGEQVALLGLDQPMAEVFVNLVTGATLPDRGEVRVFGRPTTAITDSAGWLAFVDRFGIVSQRAVLLDALSALQNLAMPFTLEIDPPDEAVRNRATMLAREIGLSEADWERPVAELDAVAQSRIRFGRAIALDPAIVLIEHITAGVPRNDVARLGTDIRQVVAARGGSLMALTADVEFGRSVAIGVLTLDPASGRLRRR